MTFSPAVLGGGFPGGWPCLSAAFMRTSTSLRNGGLLGQFLFDLLELDGHLVVGLLVFGQLGEQSVDLGHDVRRQ